MGENFPVILGAGPSGLIVGNYLKSKGIDNFRIITLEDNGFKEIKYLDLKFYKGQRTLFYSPQLSEFFNESIKYVNLIDNLSNITGVFYKNEIHNYPIQNNLVKFKFTERMKLMFSYWFRDAKLANRKNFKSWVMGTYGTYLANNIILSHTWKTIKEDLTTIQADGYGKKVIPVSKRNFSEIFAFRCSNKILKDLYDNIKKNIINGEVEEIDIESKTIRVKDCKIDIGYDVLFNTISLPKFMNLVLDVPKVVNIAGMGLNWNLMAMVTLIIPNNFILDKGFRIVYFPEKDFLFSKINIVHGSRHSSVTCEVSYRRYMKDILNNEDYRSKLVERIENDLRKSGILKNVMFSYLDVIFEIVDPAYIICDEEYEMNNSIIQSYLEEKDVFNIGRFSQWKPDMRVEHSLERIKEWWCDNEDRFFSIPE